MNSVSLKLDPETLHTDGKLEKIKNDRGYTYEDRIEIAKVLYFVMIKGLIAI